MSSYYEDLYAFDVKIKCKDAEQVNAVIEFLKLHYSDCLFEDNWFNFNDVGDNVIEVMPESNYVTAGSQSVDDILTQINNDLKAKFSLELSGGYASIDDYGIYRIDFIDGELVVESIAWLLEYNCEVIREIRETVEKVYTKGVDKDV